MTQQIQKPIIGIDLGNKTCQIFCFNIENESTEKISDENS